MFGLFNIDKPAGKTSHDVVSVVRRLLGRGVKVGHAGTLDPFATGVLVVCVGPATRLADYIRRMPKRYRAEITLGAVSTTDDPEGQITPRPNASPPDEKIIIQTMERFVCQIEQVPPSYSAVHHRGRRAYKLARAGDRPNLRARTVYVHNINLLSYDWPELSIEVTCGAGMYVRALARDIGKALEVGGYCTKLKRTAVGRFTLEAAVTLETLDPPRDIISPLAAVESHAKISLDDAELAKFINGRPVQINPSRLNSIFSSKTSYGSTESDIEVAVLNSEGNLVAIGRCDSSQEIIKPAKVFTK